ncbi:MAG: ATP-binding cassette domain-containing protein, partial [Cyanobacteria bacterium J06641_5]
MTLGTLREQLIYPSSQSDLDDTEFQAALDRVNLPDLIDRCGGLSATRNWSEELSLGEQQRLAFARVLINRPRFVILDESTSALDVPNEERLYQHLQETGVTYVSVGHRPTLRQYHRLVLEVFETANWQLQPSHNGN